MKLKSPNAIPPGGMKFKHPTSGLEKSFHAWFLLRDWVTEHCTANGFPPVTDEEIQRQICERLGPSIADQYCEGEGITVRGVGLSWQEVWNGTKVLASFITGGRKTVRKSEAERRALICVHCPRNVEFNKPCGGLCGELRETVTAIVGGESTQFDSRLGACSVCGCSGEANIWVPIEHLSKGVSPEMMEQFPENCWKHAGILELQQEKL